MYGYVYKTTDLTNGKIYVGQHKSDKFEGDDYVGSGLIINNIKKKCLADNESINKRLKVELLEEAYDKEDLDQKEKYWIMTLNAQDKDIGYNIAAGGNGGDILSCLSDDEKKDRNEKISSALRGHTFDQKTLDKISEKAKQCWNDPEFVQRRKIIDEQKWADPVNKQKHLESVRKYHQENKDAVRKSLQQRQHQLWKDEGYRKKQSEARKTEEYQKRMREVNQTKGRRCVNNGKEQYFVYPDQLQEFFDKGFVLGGLPKTEIAKENQRIAAKKRWENRPFEIYVVEMNKIFRSYSAASKELGVSDYILKKCIKDNISCNGYTIIYRQLEG